MECFYPGAFLIKAQTLYKFYRDIQFKIFNENFIYIFPFLI